MRGMYEMTVTNKFMRLGQLLAVTVLLGISSAVRAQDAAPPPPPGPDLFFIGFEEGLGGKTVTGAPFSASFSTETKQALADGNQIQRSSTGSFARDSQGRTRRDMTLPGIGPLANSSRVSPHVVMISDPVAGTQYVLEVDRKIARKMQLRQGKPGRDSAGRGARTFRGETDQSHVTSLSLGTQTISGVLAEGTRTTRTIPAGAIGNTNPIVITVERWYSPDLQTVVMLKRSDPRMGETTFQLTSIQRQEPDASLFQVPGDYTVSQGRVGRFHPGVAPGPAPDN